MRIQALNNQNFEARKLRLPVKYLDLTNPDLIEYGRQLKKVNIIQEYSNPNARKLYSEAKKTSDIKEKMRLLSEMGDYEIYDFGDGALGKFRMNLYLFFSRFTDVF